MQQRVVPVLLALIVAIAAAWFVLGPTGSERISPVASTTPRPTLPPTPTTPASTTPAHPTPPASIPPNPSAVPAGPGDAPPPVPTANPPDEALDAPLPPDDVTVWPTTREGISGAVHEVVPDIGRCYEEALLELPELQGDLIIHFVVEDVDGLGLVTEVGITAGALEDVPMEECVLDAFEVLQFDPPDGGRTEVDYPLVFSPE